MARDPCAGADGDLLCYSPPVVVEIIVHRLRGRKKALDACRLIEDLYLSGRRVLVWLADPARAALFDEYLWTFSEHSFVPHAMWSGDDSPADEPVLVSSGEPVKPRSFESLVALDRLAEPKFAASFEDVHELVTTDPADEGWAAYWEGAGFAVVERDGVATGPRNG